MKLLLTSSGVTNPSIHRALVELLGKPVSECDALFIPTAIYPFRGSPVWAWRAISGMASAPLSQLGWKSVGLLELTALPSIAKQDWGPSVEAADALLVWGGDVLYLSYWLRQSGLMDFLASLPRPPVYVGVSAGSMAVTSTIGETYLEPPSLTDGVLASEAMTFATPQGDIDRLFVTAKGAGLVDFAVIPHLDHADHLDASLANAERWAAKVPAPVYAIDDQTAIRVTDGAVDVVSEGHWRLFTP